MACHISHKRCLELVELALLEPGRSSIVVAAGNIVDIAQVDLVEPSVAEGAGDNIEVVWAVDMVGLSAVGILEPLLPQQSQLQLI